MQSDGLAMQSDRFIQVCPASLLLEPSPQGRSEIVERQTTIWVADRTQSDGLAMQSDRFIQVCLASLLLEPSRQGPSEVVERRTTIWVANRP